MFKKVLVFALTLSFSLACSSDCLECHPKLKPLEYDKHNKYYKEHHFLITCTKCHPNHSEKDMGKCGADCFECHSRQQLVHTPIPEHQKLNTCTKCHKESINDIIPAHPQNGFLDLNGGK